MFEHCKTDYDMSVTLTTSGGRELTDWKNTHAYTHTLARENVGNMFGEQRRMTFKHHIILHTYIKEDKCGGWWGC